MKRVLRCCFVIDFQFSASVLLCFSLSRSFFADSFQVILARFICSVTSSSGVFPFLLETHTKLYAHTRTRDFCFAEQNKIVLLADERTLNSNCSRPARITHDHQTPSLALRFPLFFSLSRARLFANSFLSSLPRAHTRFFVSGSAFFAAQQKKPASISFQILVVKEKKNRLAEAHRRRCTHTRTQSECFASYSKLAFSSGSSQWETLCNEKTRTVGEE